MIRVGIRIARRFLAVQLIEAEVARVRLRAALGVALDENAKLRRDLTRAMETIERDIAGRDVDQPGGAP